MAYACAKAGKSAEARAFLKKLQERSKRGYVPAYDLAVVHLALGEKEAASNGYKEPTTSMIGG